MRFGVLGAFIKRDFLIEISYRTSFILQFLGIISSVLVFYFIATFVNVSPSTPGLDGVPYVDYLLVNLAFFSYLSSAIMSVAFCVAASMAVNRAACSDAADSSSAR